MQRVNEKNKRIRHLERELGDCRRKKRRIEDEFFEMKKRLDYLERKDRQRRASEEGKGEDRNDHESHQDVNGASRKEESNGRRFKEGVTKTLTYVNFLYKQK